MLHQYATGDSRATSRLQNELDFIKSYVNTFVNLPYNQIWLFMCLAANTFRC